MRRVDAEVVDAYYDPDRCCNQGSIVKLQEDGINWDPADEFIIADCHSPEREVHRQYWHIGYPTVVQLDDGTIVTAYHEYTKDEWPIQYMQTARFRLD